MRKGRHSKISIIEMKRNKTEVEQLSQTSFFPRLFCVHRGFQKMGELHRDFKSLRVEGFRAMVEVGASSYEGRKKVWPFL